MSVEVRTITDGEVAAWSAAVNTGFLNPKGDVDAEARRPSLFLDRTWAGFDGDRVVATLRSFPTTLTVPGGAAVPVSAVTAGRASPAGWSPGSWLPPRSAASRRAS